MIKKLIKRFTRKYQVIDDAGYLDIRSNFLNSIPKQGDTLEIGPFYSPIWTGNIVKYFDILSQEDLVTRARSITGQNNIKSVPYIDYVSSKGDLRIIERKFDSVVSSHVVEHQLDFIGHLQAVSNLLEKMGKYYMVIPDKRYCFDHFNNESTIAEVISANIEKKERHSLKSVIEHRALTTHNDSYRHWNGDHGDIENKIDKIKAAISEYNTGAYIDVHAWYFTPESFKKIIMQLNDLDIINLKVKRLYPTPKGSLEFYVILGKS